MVYALKCWKCGATAEFTVKCRVCGEPTCEEDSQQGIGALFVGLYNQSHTNIDLARAVTYHSVVSTNGDYTASFSDEFILVNAPIECTITLPATTAVSIGKQMVIKDTGTKDINIVGSAGQLVEGKASFHINKKYKTVCVVSTESEWFVYSEGG